MTEFPNKQSVDEKDHEIKATILQPWSTPILKITLPSNVLQTMIEISDEVITDKNAKIAGSSFLKKEIHIELDILNRTEILGFFMEAIRQFITICKCQMMPDYREAIQKEKWLIRMLEMWIVSQQPEEYNPMHMHYRCQISAVMYIKVPKMLPFKKEYRPNNDGAILFMGNSSRDIDLSVPQLVCRPKVGDFYIFGAHQQHLVYPYRCEKGDSERRSISFNAVFQSKADYDRGEKQTSHKNERKTP